MADRLLAAFPALRERFHALMDSIVAAAVAAVERLAAALTRAIQALLDALGTVLRGILSVYEALYGAIIDVVAAAVNGVIQAARTIVTGFGIFAALVGDIAAGPGAWLSNLGAAISDGIRNHLWNALRAAVRQWFNDTIQSIVGLGRMILNVLLHGGLNLRRIGRFVWSAILAVLPMIIVQFLIERLVAMIVPAAGAVMLVVQGLMAAWGAISQIMAAVSAFVTFLLAVRGGGAGPLFAAALAASAVALIAFLAQFLMAPDARSGGRRVRTAAGAWRTDHGIPAPRRALGRPRAARRGPRGAAGRPGHRARRACGWPGDPPGGPRHRPRPAAYRPFDPARIAEAGAKAGPHAPRTRFPQRQGAFQTMASAAAAAAA